MTSLVNSSGSSLVNTSTSAPSTVLTYNEDFSNSTAEAIASDVSSKLLAINEFDFSSQQTYTYSASKSFPALYGGQPGDAEIDGPVTGTVNLPAGWNQVTVNVNYAGVAPSLVTILAPGTLAGAVPVDGYDIGLTAELGGLHLNANGNAVVVQTNAVNINNNPENRTGDLGDAITLNGTGASELYLGNGQDTVSATSGTNTIGDDNGAATFFLYGGNNLLASEGRDSVYLGSGRNTVIAGSQGLLVYGGSGSLSFTDGESASTLVGGTGAMTVFGGSAGGLYYGGSGGNNVLVSGKGATAMVGGGAGDSLYAVGSGNDTLVAGAGSEVMNGAFSTGNDVFFGGTGADTVIAGGGVSFLVGGAGTDTYDFIAGAAGGSDYIFGFKVGQDQVALFGYDNGNGSAGAADLAGAVTTAYGTAVRLQDGTSLLFVGVSHLAANSIVG